MHAVLVQVLSGNAVIAKTPTDGGGYAIAVCMELARREGLPVSLVSGSGGALSDALVRHELIDCMSFVGGRATGRDIATDLVDTSKRYMLEMEGLNAYGIWEFSQWSTLRAQIKKGYEYGKQRCTAYPRFVVQRRLLPAFLETHFSAVKSLRVGHPAVVANDTDPLPTLDFGPLINTRKVQELWEMIEEAEHSGGIPVLAGSLDRSLLAGGQSTDAYFAPYALLNVPRRCQLYHGEPFGPVDTIVVVDRVEELVAEMNVSNGSLCCSLATDDEKLAMKLKEELRGFKFGHNVMRSRGDKSEAFGGLGLSWKGCFVGGEHLVRAVTRGSGNETLAGSFEDHFRMPDGV
jgi:acyl-CoA reductase-like NAD-dependent aldehyde dehydrogenase